MLVKTQFVALIRPRWRVGTQYGRDCDGVAYWMVDLPRSLDFDLITYYRFCYWA